MRYSIETLQKVFYLKSWETFHSRDNGEKYRKHVRLNVSFDLSKSRGKTKLSNFLDNVKLQNNIKNKCIGGHTTLKTI